MAKLIFIIDDDEDILEILCLIFQDEGYNVICANNSEAADQLTEQCPDLILLDVRISGSDKDGPQICKEFKAQSDLCQAPVLLLSAELDLRRTARECGADDFLNKPFDIEDLLNKTARYLQ